MAQIEPTKEEIDAVGAITFAKNQKNPRLIAEAACKVFLAVHYHNKKTALQRLMAWIDRLFPNN